MQENYKKALMTAAAGAIGVAQTIVLQRFVDSTHPEWGVPQLGGFGKPSVLAGIVTGAAAIAAGMYSLRGGGSMAAKIYPFAPMLFAYGGTSLATGLIAGYFAQTGAASRSFSRSAAVRAVPSGMGYSQVKRTDTNIL
jgi:hypothetical protein